MDYDKFFDDIERIAATTDWEQDHKSLAINNYLLRG